MIEVIPPSKIDWAYTRSKFTLADLLRHLAAAERYVWAESVMGRPNSYPGHGRALADGYENVIEYFGRLHEESLDIFSSLDDQAMLGKCTTPNGSNITTWKWLRALVEHEIHHRGQIYVYLGILGVHVPPLFGMTSEELLALSVAQAY